MAKKFLKRYLPHPDRIKKYGFMSRLGNRIHDPNLWHLNRRSVATAVGIGLFVAFLPVPAQMLIAAFCALYLRGNMVISVTTVWISNPITFPPILYVAYTIGAWLMGNTVADHPFYELSWEWITSELNLIWWPMLLGCLILGTFCSASGYLTVRYLWRWHAMQSWKERRAMRKARKEANKP